MTQITPGGDPAEILRAVRGACASGLWSRGVKLSREDAVTLEYQGGEEIAFRVRSPGAKLGVSTTLVLTGDEDQPVDWDCDCGGRMMPCEHIAAAAIVLAQAADRPAAMKTAAERGGQIAYRLHTDPAGLRVTREILAGPAAATPLQQSLAALLADPTAAAGVAPEERDLRADLLLDARARGPLPAETLRALMAVLADAPRVSLDGAPVAVIAEPVKPVVVLEDRGDDVVLRIERDPRVTRVVAAGLVLVAGAPPALRPIGELDLSGAFLQELPRERIFPPRAFGELRTQVLPDLQARVEVEVRSRRLPATTRTLRPRVALDVTHVAGALSVLPTLVYGDPDAPPVARIDDGRLVHLRGPVPIRDEAAEQRLRLKLREDLDLLPGRRVTFEGPDAARAVERLARWSSAVTGEAADAIRARGKLRPQLAIGKGADGEVTFTLQFVLEDGAADGARKGPARTVEAAAVLAAFRDGLGLCGLGDGGFAPVPGDFLSQHATTIANLLEAREGSGTVARHALPALAALCDDLGQERPPALRALAPLVDDFSAIPPAALPGDLRATLRPYQQHGVDWLVFLRKTRLGALLADDMGLGKTLQTLCAIEGRTLIVSPTSVVPNWQREIARFRPGLSVHNYQGASRVLRADADVTLTSYALLRLDTEALSAVPWDTVVLDEAQAIKNPDSQTARAAFALPGRFRIALSGTPVENRLDELWSLCHFGNRGLLGTRASFDETFARPIAAGDDNARDRLRRRIKPFVLRRRKQEVAPELPPRIEAVLPVVLSEPERGIYDAVRAASRKDVVAMLAGGGNVMAALEALLRLRQAACHPALLPGQTADQSSKVEALRGALETAVADGHRALVFSQWTSFLDLIEPQVADLGFCRLDGSTRDRGAVVEGFQRPDGPKVMLVSLKAGGTGLNLSAADRAHRIGQDRPVMIYRLVAQDTVEEKILALQEHKRALAEAALGRAGDGAGGPADAGLTRDDLLALLD